MYPAVCQKLREEILAHVGPHKRPTYDDIRDMKYMRAVINGKSSQIVYINSDTHFLVESMRLYPSVPFNIRFRPVFFEAIGIDLLFDLESR
jgi:hypothetical protein